MVAFKKGYRIELDGLRAIAVIAVIIYHAELSWRGMTLLPGGFLGVDIFFVLSGFLITGILIERSPSLYSFYKGRLDRIYPALLLMLFFTCIAAYKFLQPSDLLVFVESLKGALGFYSNYVFMYEDSYASDASKYKALLHTWSLGIEWQYYIAFPFVIYAIKKYLPKHTEQTIIILFSASFFYCLYLMQVDSSHAFYSTFSRVWQLFAGGLVFLISRDLKDQKYDSYLSALSIVIITYSLLFFKDTDNHPGFISFSAVIGSALFILFTKPGTVVYQLLTWRVPVFLGVISYSLYLYHQPILVFYRLGYAEVSNNAFLLLFLLMLVMAYCSYRFFENPIRTSKRKIKYVVIVLLVTLVYSFANGAKNTDGYSKRQSDEAQAALVYFEGTESDRLRSDILGLNFRGDNYKICSRRTPETACLIGQGEPKVVVVGDSFSGVFTYSLAQVSDEFPLKTFHYSGCPLASDPIFFYKSYPECWEINKQRWVEIEKLKPTNIIIGTNFNLFYQAEFSNQNFKLGDVNNRGKISSDLVFQSFRKSILRLIEMGHKPIVLLQPPNPNQDVRKEMQRKVESGILYFKEERLGTPTNNIDSDVRDSLEGIKDIIFIDMNDKMCNKDGQCLTFNENGGLYNSNSHLSYFGVQLFMEDLLKAIRK